MTSLNIRNEADRNAILAAGYQWALVLPRGENKGGVVSRHKTYEAANKAAKGRELQILNVADAWTY
jgi:hypothetical protein